MIPGSAMRVAGARTTVGRPPIDTAPLVALHGPTDGSVGGGGTGTVVELDGAIVVAGAVVSVASVETDVAGAGGAVVAIDEGAPVSDPVGDADSPVPAPQLAARKAMNATTTATKPQRPPASRPDRAPARCPATAVAVVTTPWRWR